MNININRQKLGLEDITWGTETEEQLRGGVTGTITQINAANMPFDSIYTLQEVLDIALPLKEDIEVVADNINAIVAVNTDIASVNAVATNIADIVSVANTIVPNIAEILLADDNAAIATNKAAEALVSANNAAASYDSFDDRYLGAKAAAPTTDNDGDTLLQGAIYWDTAEQLLKWYSATGWANVVLQLENTLTSTSTVKALTAAQGKILQDSKQPIDATLTALAAVTTAADKLIYATGIDTFTTTTLTAAGRALIDDADAAAQRTTLGISATNTPSVAVGNIAATNVQAAIQELDSEKVDKTTVVTTAVTSVTFNADGTITIVTP